MNNFHQKITCSSSYLKEYKWLKCDEQLQQKFLGPRGVRIDSQLIEVSNLPLIIFPINYTTMQ